LVTLCSCGEPTSPVPVNARLPNSGDIYQDGLGGGDTVIIGQCLDTSKYAERRKGNRIKGWLLVRVEVVAVETGTWAGPSSQLAIGSGPRSAWADLVFVDTYSFPTAESGIMLSMLPYPYYAGNVFAFSLDSSQKPARITGQERRSLADPARKPKDIDYPKGQWNQVCDSVRTAVLEFYRKQGPNPCEPQEVLLAEQVDRAYIVQCVWNREDKMNLRFAVLAVDRETLAVKVLKQREP